MAGSSRLVCIVLCVVSACAHSVGQDDHSGDDAKEKGAREIPLDNGEGKAKGIVTYPGGDRVDWKFVQLPEKKVGTLQINLKWVPPRPGLQLAFDVFDEWNTEVATSKKPARSMHVRQRDAAIENAKGKYFIRVYAVGRGDAGTYKMTVDFSEVAAEMSIDLSKIEVPGPPKLPAIPVAEGTCDESRGDVFDPKNPACFDVCPAVATPPPKWHACIGQCVGKPDPTYEDCWGKVCPNPPTMRSTACMRTPSVFPPCDKTHPDMDNYNCTLKAPPKVARVIAVSVQGNDVVITLGIGSDEGVGTDWKGNVLRGDSEALLDGGGLTIIRVDHKKTYAKARLTTDQVNANQKVKLSPP
jgi:hypothetical protein